MRLAKVLLLLVSVQFIYCKKDNKGATAQLPGLSVSSLSVISDSVNTTLKFVVSVQPAGSKAVSVHYATVDGTAKAGTDYVAVSGTLNISPNSTQTTVEVTLTGKKVSQSKQEFYLKLSDPVNATLTQANGVAAIQNPGFTYNLVWSDEFGGTALNTTDWNYETGGNGWGNHELENYTAGTNNAYLQNGNLVIEAKQETLGANNYTSARITTQGKRKFTYGKAEIRARIPVSKGVWPALWMLGENINTKGWPVCGEIDMMENIGEMQPSKVYGTAHWGTSAAEHKSMGGNYALPSESFADSFHIYSIEWTPDDIIWSVDNHNFFQLPMQQVTGGNSPFDKQFFFTLNVAVGGDWPGSPDASTIFPQKMLVDYIRVYQK